MTNKRIATPPDGRFLIQATLAGLIVLAAAATVVAQTTQPTAPPAEQLPPEATLTVGQIQRMLDEPVKPQTIHEALLTEVIKGLEGTKGRWLDLPATTLGFLPYDAETLVSVKTLAAPARAMLDALLEPLCLEYRIVEGGGHAMVRIIPRPELARVGRRARIGEMELLYCLRRTTIKAGTPALADQIGQVLARPIEMRYELATMTPAVAAGKFNMAGLPTTGAGLPTTGAGLLDRFAIENSCTWRVHDNQIVVTDKCKQVIHQLRRHVSVAWEHVAVDQALVQLARAGGVMAQFQPGIMEGVEQGSRQITWQTPDESILQIIEQVGAKTGLAYEVREGSIYFFNPRGGKPMTDPPVGMITVPLPSKDGVLNLQVFIRRSQLSSQAQAAIDQRTKQAIDAITTVLNETPKK